jgi:pimeloyl-ACP methyl ester carboxylesterase
MQVENDGRAVRAGDAPLGLLENLDDVLAFDLGERAAVDAPRHRPVFRRDVASAHERLVEPERFVPGQDHGPFEHQPPTLITWGRNDPIFPAEGAHPYLRDLPDAELHLLDTGHFALEEDGAVIAKLIRDFMARRVVAAGPATISSVVKGE